MKAITTLLTILIMSQFSLNAFAYDSNTEAGITGAFCECNESDAFPGVSKIFTRNQLQEIKEKFETVDPRRPIDRTEERYKQLNAIGQVVTDNGFGTGVLLPGNLVLTNAHVGRVVGSYVTFNIGQSNGKGRWTDSIVGKVVTKGSYADSIPEDWALIQLDESKVNANRKYGSISATSIKTNENLKEASETGMLMTAGFPGFKDPKFLWGEKNVKVNFDKENPDTISAASSSGMSGGALLIELSPGKFKLIGLVQGAGHNQNHIEMAYRNGFSYDSKITKFVNFLDPRFMDNFKPRYREILRN